MFHNLLSHRHSMSLTGKCEEITCLHISTSSLILPIPASSSPCAPIVCKGIPNHIFIRPMSSVCACWKLLVFSVKNMCLDGWSTSSLQASSLLGRTQSPQALWPVVGLRERLWGTGTSLPQDFCDKQCKPLWSRQSKNFIFFKFTRVSWQPTTGQRAWGLWVRDWGKPQEDWGRGCPSPVVAPFARHSRYPLAADVKESLPAG